MPCTDSRLPAQSELVSLLLLPHRTSELALLLR
jgi:hypothetical protein